ncbi:MAG: cellulase family glycosylhydrolase [Cyclobacteriaceae bacterium]|nr:cellulase family glycosylhydrolase [Cyclobacteriaceae bacterium]
MKSFPLLTFYQVFFILVIMFLYNISLINTLKAQGFLKTEGQKIVDEHGKNVLLRGIGFGGWMLQEGYMLRIYNEAQQHNIKEKIEGLIGPDKTTEFYDIWLKSHVSKVDIDSLKAWGFNSVRLPMHYNLYTLPVEQEPIKGEQTWLPRGFEMTDSLLSWCTSNQMYLILDLHAAPGGQGNDLNISDRNPELPSLWESEENRQKTIELWKKLAARYKNEKWIGAYDIINEPNWGFADPKNDRNGLNEPENGPLKKLLVDITDAIRSVDKNHIIIIEGNGWGNNYRGILPVWDDNMVLSFHKYWNYNDKQSISNILKIRGDEDVPVWLGETGENSNVWFTQAIELLEAHNIGWAWWPLKKIGFNNPLEIKFTKEYESILNYWKGEGAKPSESDAYKILMDLAESARLENCIIHYDVLDAMFRQVYSLETIPFKSHKVSKSFKIPAVEYDLGRNGFAYYDLDTANYYISVESTRNVGNRGNVFRNDGVDIEQADDDEFYINHIEDGEWLLYTFEMDKKESIDLLLEVSSENAQGRFSIQIDGKPIQPNVAVPDTKGFDNWLEVGLKNIELESGMHKLRVKAEKGGYQLKSIRFQINP